MHPMQLFTDAHLLQAMQPGMVNHFPEHLITPTNFVSTSNMHIGTVKKKDWGISMEPGAIKTKFSLYITCTQSYMCIKKVCGKERCGGGGLVK
jgi:hypothetical protein